MLKSFLGGASVDLSRHVFLIGRTDAGVITPLGTAFSVSPTQIATTLDVVGADDSDLVLILPKVTSNLDYQDTADTAIRTVPIVISAADPLSGLCVITLPGITIKNPPRLASTEEASPGTAVVALGFPHERPFRLVLAQQHGRVGARILAGDAGAGHRQILLDIPARAGLTGAPILNASMTAVVAVALADGGADAGEPAQHSRTMHSGAVTQPMRAISAEYLADLL